MGRYILGVDPGFANFGWALVRLGPDSETVVDMGVLLTEKSAAKQNVLASNDNFRRARELARMIRGLKSMTQLVEPLAVCAESMSFPRSSSVAAKMAMSWGVLADYCESQDVPMFMATPKELKRAVCGDASASKETIQKALKDRYPSTDLLKLPGMADVPGGKREHPFDALAAIVACLNGETLRLLRRTSS